MNCLTVAWRSLPLAFKMPYPHPQLRPKPLSRALPQPSQAAWRRRPHISEAAAQADFALWATACETVLWPAGTFWSAYCGNRDEAVEGVIDADPIATGVRAFMATRTVWTGTASPFWAPLQKW